MTIRQRLHGWALALFKRTAPPPPDQRTVIRKLNDALVDLATRDNQARSAYMERVAELVEARQMAGTGPWTVSPAAIASTDRIISDAVTRFGQPMAVRESANAITAQGVYGDIELALQNVEWRREVNLSWLEFSRWGIQQLILICRLYYVKHPWIRRGINVSAAYVFGQGVELSSPDPHANEVLKEFRDRNKTALGQVALVEEEKRKSYDGNLFWCLFADTQDKGTVNVRIIDATEIQEIWCDPDDADKPWYYRRVWTQRTPDVGTGQMRNDSGQEWYPALGYNPTVKPESIGGHKVNWDSPVYHRKVGGVASWTFGCPRIYPAIDWAKEGRKHLEACASVTQALSQIAMQVTTKGGPQALEGIKQQMGTTVGPSSAIWDNNPPAVSGSTFVSGPGTTLAAFKTRGAGADPSEVKEFRNMVACALDIPPTWMGDMETSNLSTAQTLDRPTELGFLLRQEEWQEDLVVMGRFALEVSGRAPSGKLRAAFSGRSEGVQVREAARKFVTSPAGNKHWVYEAAKKPETGVVEVLCTFPAIREGDIPNLVKATVSAMTLENKAGQVIGIDEKAGVRHLYDLVGIQNGDELTESQYPEGEYEPDRTKEILPPPIPKAKLMPGGSPQPQPDDVPDVRGEESNRIREALVRVNRALKARSVSNGAH